VIQVIERFHKILMALSSEKDCSRSMTELAACIDVSVPACSNIVRTMVALGYVRSLGPRRHYVLGDTPYYLARHAQFNETLLAVSRELVSDLSKTLNEFAVLVVEHQEQRCELFHCEGDNELRVRVKYEQQSLLYCPTGCILLSGKDEQSIRNYWDKYHQEGNCLDVSDASQLLKELGKIKKSGKLVLIPRISDPIKRMQISISMAAPIYKNGNIIAALGMIVPMIRFSTKEEQQRITDSMVTTARAISENLSGTQS